MFKSEYFGFISIQPWEWLLAVFYVLLILVIAYAVKGRKIEDQPIYRYYVRALMLKIGGGVALCTIYMYYYHGGDTTSYYETSLAISNLFSKDVISAIRILFGENSETNFVLFNQSTGYPLRYIYFDDQAYAVVRLTTPLLLLSLKSYLIENILVAWISFFGLWRLYQLFCHYYPSLYKPLAWGILFFPSVIFWGSGLLKDTITLSAACWYMYAVFRLFIVPKRRLTYAFVFVITALIILEIKPYIFLTLFPGSLIWVFYYRILRIRNRFLRRITIPVILVACIMACYGVITLFSSSMSKFSVDRVLQTAAVTQQDLSNTAAYGSNSFNIGTFEPTLAGILSKAPLAIEAGLFRPYVWECNNIVMYLSGIENFFILLLSLIILVLIRPLRLYRIISTNPLLLFCFIFVLLFSFSVGLTTANFGALVRFKIPFQPFYTSFLIILGYFIIRGGKGTTLEEPVPQPKTPR